MFTSAGHFTDLHSLRANIYPASLPPVYHCETSVAPIKYLSFEIFVSRSLTKLQISTSLLVDEKRPCGATESNILFFTVPVNPPSRFRATLKHSGGYLLYYLGSSLDAELRCNSYLPSQTSGKLSSETVPPKLLWTPAPPI